MKVTITEPMERTEKEVFVFLLHQIALELPFEQFVQYFEPKDLDKVKEIWNEAEEEWDRIWSRHLYDKDDEDFMYWDRD